MKSKKKVFVVAVAVCLIAILSLSSLAWFTDSDEVTNKFMVATSTEDPDDIFSVDVFEQIDTDGDGVLDGNEDYDATVDVGDIPEGGYTYTDIVPAGEYGKKPWVKNTGSYDQYIRMTVTVDNAKAWMDALAKYEITDLSTIFGGHNEEDWTRGEIVYNEEADTISYTYYLNYVLEPGASEYLFTSVVIPYQLDQYDLAELADGMFEMTIVAEAVQADHTGDTAQEAFALVMGN